MDVIVAEFGVSLGKKSERLVIRRNGTVLAEHPLFQVSHVIIASNGVAVSSDLVRECALAGIPISFLSGSGKPIARMSAPEMIGSVETRRQQMFAFLDERSVCFSLAVARAKVANQAVLLKYFGKSRKQAHPELHARLRRAARQLHQRLCELDRLCSVCDSKGVTSELPTDESIAVAGAEARASGESGPETTRTSSLAWYAHETGEQECAFTPTRADCINDVRLSILAVEGRASRTYWEAIGSILPADLSFCGRVHQGATDLTNCLLNYGYGILYQQVWGAVTLAGLDPFAGFLHVDRPGKPSLVLDLVEEFRQTIVDRTVFGLLTKGVKYKLDQGRLTDEARALFAQRIFERLDATVRYEGRRERLRAVIQKQARHLACFFRRERDYVGYVGTW